MTAGELLAVAEDALPEAIGNGSDRSRSTRLGLALGANAGAFSQPLGFKKSKLPTTIPVLGRPGAWYP
jgi:hypothetical protein